MTPRHLLHTPILTIALLAAACTPLPINEGAVLPRDAVAGAGDPTRAALLSAPGAFAPGGRVIATPERAARVLANMEFLAATSNQNPLLDNAPGTLSGELRLARAEIRSALGLDPALPAQQVIDGLYDASRSMEAGAPGGPALAATGGAATIARLRALPAMPLTAAAANSASEALRSRNSQGSPIR